MVRGLGANVDETTAVVIFPEGRLFRRDRLDRTKARLALENPERAARIASLTYVLPPRPGGVLALLDTIRADVVVIAHSGLDKYQSFAELAKAVPLRTQIEVTAWRVPADQIPSDDREQIAWLDQQWVLVDEWIASRAKATDEQRQ